jgi:hypothetical protein
LASVAKGQAAAHVAARPEAAHWARAELVQAAVHVAARPEAVRLAPVEPQAALEAPAAWPAAAPDARAAAASCRRLRGLAPRRSAR